MSNQRKLYYGSKKHQILLIVCVGAYVWWKRKLLNLSTIQGGGLTQQSGKVWCALYISDINEAFKLLQNGEEMGMFPVLHTLLDDL